MQGYREAIRLGEDLQACAQEYYPFRDEHWPLFHGLWLMSRSDVMTTLTGNPPHDVNEETDYLLHAIRRATNLLQDGQSLFPLLERMSCGLLATYSRYAFALTRLFRPRPSLVFLSAYAHALLAVLEAARAYRPTRNVPFSAFARGYVLSALRESRTQMSSDVVETSGVPVWIHEYIHRRMTL